MYVHIRVPAYDMPTVRYEVIRPRHIYKSIVHVPAVSKKEGVDWMVEGAVDGIESTMSSIAFNRAAYLHYLAVGRYFHQEKGYAWHCLHGV